MITFLGKFKKLGKDLTPYDFDMGCTVLELVEKTCRKYEKGNSFREILYKMDPYAKIGVAVNGNPIGEDQLSYIPKTGDEIVISSLVGGRNSNFWTGLAIMVIVAVSWSTFGLPYTSLVHGIDLMGLSMVIGGSVQWLFGASKPPSLDAKESKQSKFFNGAVNTVGEGSTIPWGVGTCLVGGPLISGRTRNENYIP